MSQGHAQHNGGQAGQVYDYHRPSSANSRRGPSPAGPAEAQRYGASYASSGPASSSGSASNHASSNGHGDQQLHQQRHQQQQHQQQQQQQQYHTRDEDQTQSHVQAVSVMEDSDTSESDFESDPQLAMAMDPEQQHFYVQQQQQAMYYQQHQQASGGVAPEGGYQARLAGERERRGSSSSNGDGDGDDDDGFSDDSSVASIPDEEIDFGLTYALHTFLATVEGQASVVKGDSLLLLDDANSYWWLVRVLKTEDVGYIPAENIETPYERLARLNKHRNVDLAAATNNEKALAETQGKDRFKAGIGALSGKGFGIGGRHARMERAGSSADSGSRRVVFAPPTYVDHPGRTWSSDEEDEMDDEEEEEDADRSMEDDGSAQASTSRGEGELEGVDRSLDSQKMDLDGEDDGVEWADESTRTVQSGRPAVKQNTIAEQSRHQPQQAHVQAPVQAKSNNPFAQQQNSDRGQYGQAHDQSNVNPHDPAYAGNDTRRITVTPAVAQAQGGNGSALLPSAVVAGGRNASNQSVNSLVSSHSNGSLREAAGGSINSASSPTTTDSPESAKRLSKMRRSGSQDSLNSNGEKKEKKRGVLSGLFSRKNKEKKGISSSDPRASEDSFGVTQQTDQTSPVSQKLGESSSIANRAPTPAERKNGAAPSITIDTSPPQAGVTSHSLRLQQTDQARMQAYTSKYLAGSPNGTVRAPTASEAAAAVAQSAAAMRLAASMNGVTKRPSSIIVSPNPSAPLLNVMRVFAGEYVKSDASFKTVLLNDTTTSTDLIRQAIQRFRLRDAGSAGAEKSYFLTVRDVIGDEMELAPDDKPLPVFLDAVQRWSEENNSPVDRSGAITPTVKRSSIASVSSVTSLSNHPAIAKLGMNDFSDDSAVKIYLHRRRPGSMQFGQPNGDTSTYSNQLSTVPEGTPESLSANGVKNQQFAGPNQQAQGRFNPSLTVNTKGQSSPERFSSPSVRFTVQLTMHAADLPDGSVFDVSTDAVVSKQVLRDRLMAGHPTHSRDLPQDSRRRLFLLPRNATVVEAIEQGLERFGIYDGVVDGGDEIEDRGGKSRGSKVRYCLAVLLNGRERVLSASSRLLDSYSAPPTFKPVERSTPEQKRRSREWSYSSGSVNDLLPSDPTFVLRRSGRPSVGNGIDMPKGVLQQQQALAAGEPVARPAGGESENDGRGAMSPQEIIAAQRAASRANQDAIISAHANKSQGVDIVLPDRGTLRSSRLLEPEGEVVRYSFIDYYGETYDISELLEEEWGPEGENQSASNNHLLKPGKPTLERQTTDRSEYVTAPSTPAPEERRGSVDLLAGAVEASGKQTGQLEERLARVIEKVKAKKAPSIRSDSNGVEGSLRTTSAQSQRSRPMSRNISGMMVEQEKQQAGVDHAGAIGGGPRSNSRQAEYANTAASVNKIISRHRQQPSIASIMTMSEATSATHDDASSVSTVTRDREQDTIVASRERERDRASTPATATSSTHPTPPLGSAIFTRAVSSVSPTPRPRTPVKYTDDFGMKTLMGLVEARARGMKPFPTSRKSNRARSPSKVAPRRTSRSASITSETSEKHQQQHRGHENGDADDEAEDEATRDVTRLFWGEKFSRADMDAVHPDLRQGVQSVMLRLDAWDAEVDELLGTLAGSTMFGSLPAGERRDSERSRGSISG